MYAEDFLVEEINYSAEFAKSLLRIYRFEHSLQSFTRFRGDYSFKFSLITHWYIFDGQNHPKRKFIVFFLHIWKITFTRFAIGLLILKLIDDGSFSKGMRKSYSWDSLTRSDQITISITEYFLGLTVRFSARTFYI